jgi:hypothetical protein
LAAIITHNPKLSFGFVIKRIGATAMPTSRHTIDAKIPYQFHVPCCLDAERVDLLTRVVYQYEFNGAGFCLTVVDARILSDEHETPHNVNSWAQDWIDLDGYDRACTHAEAERAQ